MRKALDTTRELGDALALRRRFTDGTGVGIVLSPHPAQSLAYQRLRRLLGGSSAREGVFILAIQQLHGTFYGGFQ